MKIKKCPMCGNEHPYTYVTWKETCDMSPMYVIQCKCGLTMKKHTETLAAQAWNKRIYEE